MGSTLQTSDSLSPGLDRIARRYLVWGLLGAAVFSLAAAMIGVSELYWVRLLSYLGLFVVAAFIHRSGGSVVPVLAAFYVLWWIIPIIDIASEVDYGFGDRTAVAVALLIGSVGLAALHRPGRLLLTVFSVANGSWALITGLQANVEYSEIGGEVLALVVGYWLLSRLVIRLIDDAGEGFAQAHRAATIQEALATTSERLLGGAGDPAIEQTLVGLLDEISPETLLVEEVDRNGDGVRRIVAVAGDLGAERTRDGKLDDLPTLERSMGDRKPLVVATAELSEDQAARYGPYRVEMAFPIVVGGEVWGRLSALTADPNQSWPRDEILMLTRTALLIATYWEREDASERLRDLMRSKDAFIASVSHELRTPLTVVLGLSEELAGSQLRGVDQEELRELHRMVAEQSSEMARIVEDLLVAARADLGTLTVRYESVDVRASIEEVIDRIRSTFLETRTLTIEGEAGNAYVDALRFRQIVRNLVTNAAKYGGREIEIALSEDEECVRVVIADNGAGIPRELAEAIFEPYTTAHTSDGRPGSMGLGLTVARDLARLMGGDLSLRMTPGRTEFLGTFPRAPVTG